jgi:DNA modification methylase
MTSKIILGDCIIEMRKLPDNSVDAIITDPPYDLTSQRVYSKEKEVEEIKGDGTLNRNIKENTAYGSLVKGFMGKNWDGTGIAFKTETWKECYRILKSGGHLLSFGGTRTYHRMATAIEEAGFEIRDMIEWIYGSGFPKSLNISKAIEKQKGIKPIGKKPAYGSIASRELIDQRGWNNINNALIMPETQTLEAKQWEGWGTALKPSHEPIVLARKPLSEKTIAENVLKHRTGGINIDESRIECDMITDQVQNRTMIQRADGKEKGWGMKPQGKVQVVDLEKGRFPANIIHDGSPEVMAEFPDVEEETLTDNSKQKTLQGEIIEKNIINSSRFFYCAKASKKERDCGCNMLDDKDGGHYAQDEYSRNHMGNTPDNKREPVKNNHPTVKPISLMKYLIKLITPPKGTVLDPFMGSGTTGVACAELDFDFIGIEKEPEYIKIAEARIKHYTEQKKLSETTYDEPDNTL